MSAYCTQAQIESRFGVENILTWATLTSGDSEAVRTARIVVAIAVASDELDEVLRCISEIESKLPISTVSDSVADKVAINAGLWLYSFHASDDYAEHKGHLPRLEEKYEQWISEVRAGTRKLSIP